MKVLLPLVALALLLAGCTTTDESNDGAENSNGTTTGSQSGGEVSGEMTVVEGNETSTGNSTNTSG